jgi:polyhydroxyalkanoate synthesis repressor PhaR
MSSGKKSSERLIKKYPNRRLYDTQTSSYITLSDVKQLVLEADEFTVVDAKTNEDLTRSILLQIILEEEAHGAPMFSSAVLSQIIRYYGHAMQGMMGSYLEKNVQAFTDIQNKFVGNAAGALEGKPFSTEMWTQFMNIQGPMMQGMMGSYLEKNVQAFTDIQNKFVGSATGALEGKPFSTEMWTQFMNIQGPMMQGMMNNYIDQSKNLFLQMQEQMQNQSKAMFGAAFPFGTPPEKK